MKKFITMESQKVMDKHIPELLNSIAHLKIHNNEILACVLNLSDISVNANKFYIIQLLERHDNKAYFLFTRSGRVGYKGTEGVDCFIYESDAINAFKDLFKDKTGLSWEDRDNDAINFDSSKYQYIKMKFEEIESVTSIISKNKVSSKLDLDSKVHSLLDVLFNQELYTQTLKQYNVDAQRAPLGSISQTQINRAYKVLKKLENLINDKCNNNEEFITTTSEFYSIIPSYFGMSKAPVLNTMSLIENKVELLKILENLEVFKDMSKLTVHDDQYLALNCQIKPVTIEEASLLTSYFYNTQGKTHSIKLKIKDMFAINRIEEEMRYLKWKTLHNRQLLWHGSRLCNFVGILTKGLLLNPGAEIAKTGAMFGYGLYFANCATKSANYMGISSGEPGIMILCEVALGTCLKLHHSQHYSSSTLKAPYTSVQGIGQYTPDEKGYTTQADGLIIPNGILIDQGQPGSLLYDEFIVYDQSQVKIKYLILFEAK